MRIAVLASGSKGNSVFIGSDNCGILIDAGISAKQIIERLSKLSVDASIVKAVCVTHEHSDHVKGIDVFTRKMRIPVFVNRNTKEALERSGKYKSEVEFAIFNGAFMVGDLKIQPFPISHDAIDPVGYAVSHNGKKVVVATDLGMVTTVVQQHLNEADFLILEANHDSNMLMCGDYPWDLKERIRSRKGHLSNLDAGRALKSALHSRMQRVLLAHRSEDNNEPELAKKTIIKIISDTPFAGLPVELTNQNEPTRIYEIV